MMFFNFLKSLQHFLNNLFRSEKKIMSMLLAAGMWKWLFFKRFRFRFHTYRFRFRFHRFSFHQQKTKKQSLTIFFNFCGFVACLLLHFIILRKRKPSFTAITLPTSLELIVRTTLCLFFLDIKTRAECRIVLLNLFCHRGAPNVLLRLSRNSH